VATFVLMVVTVQCFRPPAETGAVEIGRAAPQFMLPDISGREVTLDQYKGKIVILDFWQTTCPPCRYTMPMLDKIQEDYAGKISILAINLTEPVDLVRSYILEQNVNSRVLMDGDSSVGSRYGTITIPMQFLIDQEGVVRNIWNGFSPAMDADIRAEINKLL
jgi:cytochrome c biogenesis protein CcmG/thiol:disulfide interchange protein DsbE